MKVLLIPSAVLLPKELGRKFGNIPTGMIPLGNKTMLENIINQYHPYVDKIYIVGYEKFDQIEKYIEAKKVDVILIKLDHVDDLGYTIKHAIEKILEKNKIIDYLYINFADSLIENFNYDDFSNFALYARGSAEKRWTYFLQSDGRITYIYDKGLAENDCEFHDKTNMFVGIFGLNRIDVFLNCYEFAAKDNKIDSFYQTLKIYSETIKMNFIETKKWIDAGHIDTYFQAQTKVAARNFNLIDIDDKRGILLKRSKNKEKLIDEIKWYLRLPGNLQYLTPRIYDYSLDYNAPFVKMEYYGYRTLHELLLYSDIPEIEWEMIFNKLAFIVSDMQSYRVEGRTTECINAVIDMYINKTISRLLSLKNEKDFAIFFEKDIIINGKKYPSIKEIIRKIKYSVKNILIDNAEEKFTIIHGDLCFTNILVEDSYKFLRIIDPRGKFGTFDIYGDKRYELAKLLHSLEGGYDYIIEDMFDLSIRGNCINYKLRRSNNIACNAFKKVFVINKSFKEELRLIEATLFLGMIPLHSDSLRRQYAMMATGIQLLSKAEMEGFDNE